MDDLEKKIDRLEFKRDHLKQRLNEINKKLKELEKMESNILEAQKIAQDVAILTQNQIEEKLSGLVSTALKVVFGEKYTFKIKFDIKRGQSEIYLLFVDKNGEEYSPLAESGGGVVDVAALALRMSLLSLEGKSDPVMILDEPFRFVSKDNLPKVIKFLIEIQKGLGFQFIIVTQEPEFTEYGKIFEVRKNETTLVTERN